MIGTARNATIRTLQGEIDVTDVRQKKSLLVVSATALNQHWGHLERKLLKIAVLCYADKYWLK